MAESLIAVPTGAYRFEARPLVAALRSLWPETSFTSASGRVAALSAGQIEVSVDGDLMALINVDIQGTSLGVDWWDPAVFVRVVAAVTSLQNFPSDDSVVLSDWAPAVVPLRAGMTPDEVGELRR